MKRIMLCSLAILFMMTGVSCTMTSKDPNTSATEITEPSWFSASQMVDPHALEDILSRIDNETPYQELITKEIDIQLFLKKYDSDPTAVITAPPRLITVVDNDFGIECLRETEAGALYSVHKMKQGGLLYVFYHTISDDKRGQYVSIKNWYCVQKNLCYEDFSSVVKGTPLKNVIKIDPVAKIYTDRAYQFNKAGDALSYHYLNDGILVIGYTNVNGKFTVEGLRIWTDFHVEEANYGSEKVELYDGHILPIDRIDS